MSLLLTALTRLASCVFLFAVILYVPGFVPLLALPKRIRHARADSGRARRPATVGCSRRLAETEAEVTAVRYAAPRRAPIRTEAAACVLAG